jgi:hypothetical protein
MAATASIFDLVSIDYPINAWVDWSNRKVPFDDQHHCAFKMAAMAAILS